MANRCKLIIPGLLVYWDCSVHIREIGWNDCYLMEKLEKDPSINRLTIRGKIFDPTKIRIIMNTLKNPQVKVLNVSYLMNIDVVKCLADGLRYTNIMTLNLSRSNIGSRETMYLADILKDTCITHLNIGHNNIEDDGVEYLLEHLKHSNITHLNLDSNDISNHSVKYLAKHLQDTCITSLSLCNEKINDSGIQCLVETLQNTKIIKISLSWANFGYFTKRKIQEATSYNETMASNIQSSFKKLVDLNTQTYDFEFIIPNEIKDFDMAEYLYIIKPLNDDPMFKGYILGMIARSDYADIPDFVIKKTNEFLETIQNKFNTFFDNKLPSLVELFHSYDYVNLVKQFEDMKLHAVVENLLLHRVLYYVDENAEILHPYIYKMLDKYCMPLYNEQLEPEKKEKIISFYQNHQEIDGAHELIDLLGSESLQIYGN